VNASHGTKRTKCMSAVTLVLTIPCSIGSGTEDGSGTGFTKLPTYPTLLDTIALRGSFVKASP